MTDRDECFAPSDLPQTGPERTGHPGVREVDSKSLLGAENLVTIRHRGENYILRQTRAGKLILTK
ncbi:MAG: hemin uptake protein HemP [Pseudomonadota bacterium]